MEILLFLAFILAIITVAGHISWVIWRGIFRFIVRTVNPETQKEEGPRCVHCKANISPQNTYCAKCGGKQPTDIVAELLKDLAATERQLKRFFRSGAIDEATYESLRVRLEAERSRLDNRQGVTPPTVAVDLEPKSQPASVVTPPEVVQEPAPRPSVVTVSEVITSTTALVDGGTDPQPRVEQIIARETQISTSVPIWQAESREEPPPPPPPSQPRRSFSEVLTAFMEESNIRWGEIIGGLLIIGCSTALVVSLWAQISAIPVLKFLIFTTVTAALFGVGLYTEHRWKLPTTSRGILTIATLLVPLNFLAIAAVSGSSLPQGSLVIASELIAPALFLCLVYFAGRVITPKWPHLLAAGVLGSSVGQLLIRHFAQSDNSPELMLALGAFPILCYVAAVAWVLWIALEDRQIDEAETIAIFVSLGALTFAAVLPFGLLLYKSGPISMSMMYLAPLVSLGGIPLLFSGTLLWKRVTAKELVASRVAGTSIALLGTMVVVLGMILAWPNPASVVPAALLNFAVLVTIAVLLELPVAHFLAALCFSLAFLVVTHVVGGNLPWQNLRVVSLLDVMARGSSGQALLFLFIPFVIASILLEKKQRAKDSFWYLTSACVVAGTSLLLLTKYGYNIPGDPHFIWLCYLFYAIGAFFLAFRKGSRVFGWVGSFLFLVAASQAIGPWLGFDFPWQTAFLFHAGICAVAAIIVSRVTGLRARALERPLSQAALITSVFALLSLVQANEWETTAMQAERMFWLAGVWLVSLWLNRKRSLLTVFQIALTAAVILAIKATLQQYEWYAYLPDAFLHPVALQIQGTALVLLSLIWVALRFVTERYQTDEVAAASESWTAAAARLLTGRFAFDRLVTWILLGGFSLLVFYGAFSGVKQELTARGAATPTWDIVGFPHQLALGLGSWILLGLLVVTMLANLRQRKREIYLLGAVAALTLMSPLLAGLWETQIAMASAWRWFAALFLVAASVPVWMRSKTNFSLFLFGNPSAEVRPTLRNLRVLLLVTTLIPLLFLTAYPALRAIYYMPIHGPGAGIFFALGDTLSYSLPVVLVGLVLIAYAVVERLVSYAFSAGFFFNLAVTMVFLLSVVAVHGDMNRIVLVRVIQLNVISSSLYGILWLSLRGRWQPHLKSPRTDYAAILFKTQVGMAIAGLVVVLVPAVVYLIAWPSQTGSGCAAIGGIYGWLAFVLSFVAVGWLWRSYDQDLSADMLCGLLICLACLVTFTATGLGFSGWGQYHVLMFGWAVVAWLMWSLRSMPAWTFGRRFPFTSAWEGHTALYSTLAGVAVVLLALRAAPADAMGASWSIAALVLMSALAAALNWQTLRQAYLFTAAILLNTAASIWWWNFAPEQFSSQLDLVCLNVAVGCLAGILWLWLDIRAARLSPSQSKSAEVLIHHFLALASLSSMPFVLLVSFADGARGIQAAQLSFTLGWLAVLSLAALMFACLWDKRAGYAVAGLYLVGLLGAAMAVRQAELSPRHLLWTSLIVLAIYTVVGSLLWRQRQTLIRFAAQLKIPARLEPDATQLRWLQVFTAALIIVIAGLAYYVDLYFLEGTLRVTAALAVIVQALALSLLVPADKPQPWRKAAFAVLVIGGILFGWAWLVPGLTGTWLNRAVILMVEMFGLMALYGLELDKLIKREPEWTAAISECVPWLASAGVLALLFTLGTEVYYQMEFGAVRVRPLALVTTGITLIAATVISIVFAVSPKHDPLGLPEKRRRNYVYVAEALLALFFMHIRLTMPWLFSGFFERYWPFVVVGLAYAGVTVSEILRRRELLVLAHPIERTGVFLPLLPVLGFWLTNSEVDYSALLFIVGGLYGLVSILRRSFLFGVLAVLAGNGGLWYMWHRTVDYGFLQHPQLWLIPAAASVLVAAYMNRSEFSEDQMIGVRYLALLVIYVSSTADIFINGVANSPWLPLILAALSLAGVFGGILVRVRAFLLLGSVFLLLAVMTMIYYASHNFGWTWLWYVAGIVTGSMIIFTFAMFEKKREEMLRVVEGLREWQR